MKTLNTSTTGQLLNELGILDHCDYAGQYQSEAFDILNQIIDIPEFSNNEWADILFNKKGEIFAVYAEDALTCYNEKCLYVQIEEKDCPKAFRFVKQYLLETEEKN